MSKTVQKDVLNGTCFQVSIDFDIKDKPLAEAIKLINYQNLSALNVLLAEDNPVNQMVVEGMMAKLGVQVTVVSNENEAVDIVCGKKSGWENEQSY